MSDRNVDPEKIESRNAKCRERHYRDTPPIPDPYCWDCDHDTHSCKGCGKPINHDDKACEDCMLIT